MRRSLPEPHRSPVGLHNLPHQFEAQAVLAALGAGDICRPVQRLQPGGIYSNAIICHHAGASLLLRAYHDGDMAALGIMDDAVADQIVQHPPQEDGAQREDTTALLHSAICRMRGICVPQAVQGRIWRYAGAP